MLSKRAFQPVKVVRSVLGFEALCAIFSGIKPYQTTNTFLLEAATSDDARLLLDLASNLPPLANVRIHIKASLDGVSLLWNSHRLDQWKRDTKIVIGASGRKLTNKPLSPFQFERLPVELQIMVLSYTSLALTFKTRGGIALCAKLPGIAWCCGTCQDVFDVEYPSLPSHSRCWCNRGLCYSSSCACRQYLTHPLFSTSHAMREKVLEVAFSENRFLISVQNVKALETAPDVFFLMPTTRTQWVSTLPSISRNYISAQTSKNSSASYFSSVDAAISVDST